jgi:flagellar hook-associated protein 2
MSGNVSSLGSSQISSQLAQVQARLQKPITQLQTQAAAEQTSISAWGAIQGAVSSLSGTLAGISNISTINNRSATSSATSIATATATNKAATGAYNLTNITLAKQQEIYTNLQPSASASVGAAGSLTITLKSGKSENISLSSGNVTLNSIAQAINQLKGGVAASIIGTTGGARLVLQSSATGADQGFSIAGTGGLAQYSFASASAKSSANILTLAQAAASASLNINGVPVTNASNSITSAISGVTINLAASGSTKLSVGSSPGSIAAAVGAVASSLNAAVAAIAKQTAFKPASSANAASATAAAAGPLLGNFSASNLSNQLLSAISGAAASGVTSNAIGLTVSSTGAVGFNSGTFATAYAANPTGVTALVNQIYKTLSASTVSALGSAATTSSSASTTATTTVTGNGTGTGNGTYKGFIAAQTSSLTAQIASLNSQATQIAQANNAQIQILIQEYTLAETAATAASTTQAYLSIFTSIGSGTSKG